ncbi:MAG TPA: methyltransferase domain-containing protein [Stellaceae bacterium]|nr:methyltransferase domain-containing protein [Stellaceae bacterium]
MQVAGFTRLDGAMNFFGFVNALLHPGMTVVDFGAGRGNASEYPESPYRSAYCSLRGKAAKVIGIDIDPIVQQNPSVDEAIVIAPGGVIPLDDGNVDLVVSLSTFEHITDPEPLQRELFRILKPGGWVCAVTPNRYGYLAIGARIVPNSLHKRVLRWMQPQRPSIDVFPTVYKLNTKSAIRRYFGADDWDLFMFPWNGEPCYMEDNRAAVSLLALAGKHFPDSMLSHWHIFLRKRHRAA